VERRNKEASMKNLENHIARIAKQIFNQSNVSFSGNTQDNPKKRNASNTPFNTHFSTLSLIG